MEVNFLRTAHLSIVIDISRDVLQYVSDLL